MNSENDWSLATNGGSLRIAISEEAWIIYSVGPNLTDDNGATESLTDVGFRFCVPRPPADRVSEP